jgi:predicted Holliday junction resolvase-like endonuclease
MFLLDIVLNDGLFFVILIAIGLIIWFIRADLRDKHSTAYVKLMFDTDKKIKELQSIIDTNTAQQSLILTNKDLTIKTTVLEKDGMIETLRTALAQVESQVKGNAQDLAVKWFEGWKLKEWEEYKKKADEAGTELGKLLARKWIMENEETIRKDTAKRTIAVNMGRMTEHLVPFSEEFKEFNSKDARFIGSPVDLIVFDGLTDKRPEITIYFIEVKTGNSAVTDTQRKVAQAIDAIPPRIKWKLIRREEFNWKTPDSEIL